MLYLLQVVREEGTLLTACEQLLASLWDDPTPFPLVSPISPPTPPTAMSQGTTPPPSSTTVTPPTTEPVTPTPILPPTAAAPDNTTPPSSSHPPSGVSPSVNSTISSSPCTPTVVPMVDQSVVPPPLTPSPTPSPDLSGKTVLGAVGVVSVTPSITTVGDVLPYYPAVLRLALLPRVADESIPKRLMTCILACLRAKGKHSK